MANKLSLNIQCRQNCVYDIYKKNNANTCVNNFKIQIGNEIIQKKTSTKFLGMYIDDQLKWTTHIHHCKSKLSSSLYALKAAKHFLTINHMETLYYSMIHPYLDYGALLWCSASKTNIKPIEILQNKTIRILTNSSYNTHTKPPFKKSRILTFHDMHKLHIDKFMYE